MKNLVKKHLRVFMIGVLLLIGIMVVNPIRPLHLDNLIQIEYYLEYPKGSVQKRHLKDIPNEYLLAMVAIHECINLYPQDTKFIQEATWNRVELNWGGYGNTLSQQLCSSEFRGLIDSNFYFNPDNSKHIFALETAKRVLKGHKESENKLLIGWLTTYDSDSKHVNKASKKVIPTPTWHKFWSK